jgi:hypothetical protein
MNSISWKHAERSRCISCNKRWVGIDFIDFLYLCPSNCSNCSSNDYSLRKECPCDIARQELHDTGSYHVLSHEEWINSCENL